VIVDLTLTDDLIAEGTARDIVRAVQQARRDAGLDVSDRISLTLGLDEETERRVNSYLGYISGETLATSLAIDGALPRTIATEDVTIGVALERLP
jgi:isoleucyl-tRNA synthetase